MIQSRYYTAGREGKKVSLIVMHTMESPEKPDTAESVAAWFAVGPAKSSVHYCTDTNSSVRCVKETDTAWHSGHWPTNLRSIGIELAGQAGQTKAQWHDSYSVNELKQAARLVALLVRRYNIPILHLSPKQLAAGGSGICGHVDVTAAFNVAGGHTDPGPNFPWADFLQLVKTMSKIK